MKSHYEPIFSSSSSLTSFDDNLVLGYPNRLKSTVLKHSKKPSPIHFAKTSIRLAPLHVMNRLTFLKLVPIAAIVSSCCSYPKVHTRKSENNREVGVIIHNPDTIAAVWNSNYREAKLATELKCPTRSNVRFAPATEANSLPRFGAFAIRHGSNNHRVSAYWWSRKGQLRSYSYPSPQNHRLDFNWLSPHLLSIKQGKEIHRIIRIRDDDGAQYDVVR